ncbi:MAG: hypothetical protein ACLFRL_06695 [Desulfohalobiaceae bacterium]
MAAISGLDPWSSFLALNSQGLSRDAEGKGQEGAKPESGTSGAGLDQVQVFDAAHSFFNLSSRNRLQGYLGLNPEEKQAFAETVGELAQNGHIGYEILDVQNRPYKSFIDSKIADSQISKAQTYDRHGHYRQSLF